MQIQASSPGNPVSLGSQTCERLFSISVTGAQARLPRLLGAGSSLLCALGLGDRQVRREHVEPSRVQRCWKAGLRLSRKAAMPSFWSAVANSE